MSAEILIPAESREQAAFRVLEFIKACRPGRRLKVTVAEAQSERSDAQNRSLWGVAYPPLMDFMGLRGEREKEELHEFWCGEYFGWVTYEIMGQLKKRPKRSTTTDENGKRSVMLTEEFMQFFAFIQQRSAEHGVYIPDPDPEWFRLEDKAKELQEYRRAA